jgi:Right handed beta helix region
MKSVSMSLAGAAVVLLLSAGVASARTLTVAVNGLDGDLCGTAAQPCRSLSQAIRLALPGDTIVVGPGRYGDLSFNGTFGDPGDETASPECACMILIDKRVVIVSRDGAFNTVLDATGLSAGFDVVRIGADGAIFGRRRQGFTIVNSSGTGIVIAGGADGTRTTNVRVEGHVITRNAAGLRIDADTSAVVGNVVIANDGAAVTVDGRGNQVMRTVAIANGQGVSTRADTTAFQDNVLLANTGPGFLVEVASASSYTRNVVVGNRFGFYMPLVTDLGGVPAIRSSDILGNLGDAIATGMSTIASGNNIMGNGAAFADGIAYGDHCGVFVDEGWTLLATQNYWGDRLGPAAPAADHSCSADNATVVPFRTTEFRYSEGPRDLVP